MAKEADRRGEGERDGDGGNGNVAGSDGSGVGPARGAGDLGERETKLTCVGAGERRC